jgi:DNA topoisomerase-3
LLDKFISKKGRPFSAYLKLEKTGKVAFEFEPRAKGAKNGAAAKPARKKASQPTKRRPPAAAAATPPSAESVPAS